jgi:MFS transporter, AAHS family, 4-hydroxybenzoate transporter
MGDDVIEDVRVIGEGGLLEREKKPLGELIDTSPLSLPQFIVIGLCSLVTMIDGFDTQSVGVAASNIAATWRVSVGQFGPVFSAGLFGGLLGAPLFGRIADRLGRRPALLLAVCMSGLVTLATPHCSSLLQLTGVRLLTGLGIGGSLPCAISLTMEYAPHRLRSTLVSMMFCGFPLGASLGGSIAAAFLPVYGWRDFFYLDAFAALALLPVLALFLPESACFLANRRPDRLAPLVAKWGWTGRWNGTSGFAGERPKESVAGLFRKGLASQTLLLWATLFCALLLTYLLLNWLPVLARRGGIDPKSAILTVAALNLGSIVGILIISRLGDRLGAKRTIAVAFAIGALAVACLGLDLGSPVYMIGVAFLAGFFSIGAQIGTVAISPTIYATILRGTGVGWAVAAGRSGAIVGPLLGGALLGMRLSSTTLFVIVATVSLTAAVAMGNLSLIRHAETG